MGNTVQVHFFGPISVATVESLRNMLLNALKTPELDGIELLMSSEGGDLNSGFTAYNYIRSLPVKVTTFNMGSIESIAMLPYLAGEMRLAAPNTRFIMHNFTWTFQNVPTDLNRVSERSESLVADVERFMAIYKDRTSAASEPIDAHIHLTGPAAIIGNDAALRAGILTGGGGGFPTLTQTAVYDRIFK